MNLDLNGILKFLAAISITLAQLGAIDSLEHKTSTMERKVVEYRFKHFLGILLKIARMIGRTTGFETFAMKKHHFWET